ncbi:MAG: formylglycine-generating enzyme family protein [Nitrospirota bacterium]
MDERSESRAKTPMKRDALFYGLVAAFIAFVLMIVFMLYAMVQSRAVLRQAAQTRSTPAEAVRTEQWDFTQLRVVKQDDGSDMVLVPEGPFLMGSPPVEGDQDEMPQRGVFVGAFWIDLFEVTFAQYELFTRATRAPTPVIPVLQDDPAKLTAPEQPVVAVSWTQASAYCAWLGKRLPTEAEWEKAARGDRAVAWPWGSVFGPGLANIQGADDGFAYTAPPGSFPKGRSFYGLYDASGNVAEWVADWYDHTYYLGAPFESPKGPETGKHRVYRGGSWNDTPSDVRAAKRFAAAPHQTSAVIGFRCAKSDG